MSRVGKKPVLIPGGLTVGLDGTVISFSIGSLSRCLDTMGRVLVSLEGSRLSFLPLDNSPTSRAFWGTYRSLANNIVVGLDRGFEKSLEINGVGYRASVSGEVLELSLGFSHPVFYRVPNGIEIRVSKNIIHVRGSDKQRVGQVAAEIRGFRPPEPYKGKGVRYVGEFVFRKAGKTSKR